METMERRAHESQCNRVITMASKMFASQGIRKVRMDDVAAALTMSKRTLYEMFDDKEHLLLECIKSDQECKQEYAQEVAATSENVLEIIVRIYQHGMDEMQAFNGSFFIDIKRYPKVCEWLNQRREENKGRTKAFFLAGVEQGIFRSDLNYDIFQYLMGLSMNGYFNNVESMKWSMAEVMETVLYTNIRGICTEKGQLLFDQYLEKRK